MKGPIDLTAIGLRCTHENDTYDSYIYSYARGADVVLILQQFKDKNGYGGLSDKDWHMKFMINDKWQFDTVAKHDIMTCHILYLLAYYGCPIALRHERCEKINKLLSA